MDIRGKKSCNWMKYLIIAALIHIVGISLLLIKVREYAQLIGFGFIAYTLGMRHAFDADHIAAIDNIVRKFVQQKKEPAGVGFFFSLGHSSVVFIMAILTAFSMNWVQNNIPSIKAVGSLVGTAVSGSFLIIIGLLNLYIWFDIYKLFVNARNDKYDSLQLDKLLQNRGFISRFLGPLYRHINKSWHVYPLGFLFGLGFDTASEVALLAVSANAASQMIPISVIIALPILFAAGMSLMDTLDGIFMTTAYNWAFSTPLSKIYYNLSVTGLSVIAALLIGFIELAQIIAPKLGLEDGIWRWIGSLNFDNIGYLLVGLFILFWGCSYCLWRVLHLEKA